MKLKIRYENEYQTIDLSPADTDQLWVFLDLEGDDLTNEEREALIQETWEAKYNRPDYNNWHRMNRHIGNSKARPEEGEEADNDVDELLIEDVADPSIFYRDELQREEEYTYDDWCGKIRAAMKPDYAEMLIAIHLDGIPCDEYARSIGEKLNTVNHRLQRAEKKFREIFPRTSF